MLRIILRAIVWIVPIPVALAMLAAARAGILTQKHVSNAEAIGFVLAVFAVAYLVLVWTRKKKTPQRRPSAANWKIVPAGRRGRR